jgi:hypothetical protein
MLAKDEPCNLASPETSDKIAALSVSSKDTLSWQEEQRRGGGGAGGVDLDAWRGDLQTLHGALDQVVQGFIATQTRQLEAVAEELAVRKDRIEAKERHFSELSDSIAGFVGQEVKRLEACGLMSEDAEVEKQREAYDADLPGPPALHRINRLWRKTTAAFHAAQKAAEQEQASALEEQRERLEAAVAAAEARCEAQRVEVRGESADLQRQLESLRAAGEAKDKCAGVLSEEHNSLHRQVEEAERKFIQLADRFAQQEKAARLREYEWGVEREELVREDGGAQERLKEQDREIAEARDREVELTRKCTQRAEQLQQMQKLMDEQEQEMTAKIDRVQQYVKERQACALHAEKKTQDTERMSQRWQEEVQRIQAERDKLAQLVLELEKKTIDQGKLFQDAHDRHQQELAALQETIRRKDDEMQEANKESLQQRDAEYVQKNNLEKSRERERSAAQLKKKEQELQIKDQQLKAARQALQNVEAGSATGNALPSISSPRGARRPSSGDGSLPRLPLSAR